MHIQRRSILSMKKFLWTMAGIFGVAAIILYFVSIQKLNSSAASFLGTDSVVNIQGTIYCAACAVICACNIIGALLLDAFESVHMSLIGKIDSANRASSGKNTTATSIPSTVSHISSEVSFNKTNHQDNGNPASQSWVCNKCGTHNSIRTIVCRKCGARQN